MRRTSLILPIVLVSQVSAGAAAAPQTPRIQVSAANAGCPSVAGTFVGLLTPNRGILLLSGAPFPGATEVGVPAEGPIRVSSQRGVWSIDAVSTLEGPAGLWAASWPFEGAGGTGCVAFEKSRFSSEGDVASYVRWLVERIYLQLPLEARQLWPALHLGEREIALRIEQPAVQPLRLTGAEGSVMALRPAAYEGRILITPFVLDLATETVAIRIARTGEKYFAANTRQSASFLIAAPGRPGRTDDPPMTITPSLTAPSAAR